ncbi:CDP-diacylglycerol--serine O-phosphatidyltransferase, partial [Acinetobacter baumannii]
GKFGWICAFLYAVAAAFRLARFNVQLDVVDKRYFIGLASPLAASIVAAFVWVGVDNRLLQEVPGLAIVAALVTVAA